MRSEVLAGVASLALLAVVGACRPKTAPYGPRVYVPVADGLPEPPATQRAARLVPEASLLVEGRQMPRGHRSPVDSRVWVPAADIDRGLKIERYR